MKFEAGAQLLELGDLVNVQTGNQNIRLAPAHGAHNSGNVTRSFSLAEDDFGKTTPQGAMMIDFGYAEIFERQVTQTSDSLRNRQFLLAHMLQQLFETFGVHHRIDGSKLCPAVIQFIRLTAVSVL